MNVFEILDEDFVNYKKPSMFIGTTSCDWKCCREQNIELSSCQNYEARISKTINIDDSVIFNRYVCNPITYAVVIGGLEPFLQFDEIFNLLTYFRSNNCLDDFVIYTGYHEYEIESCVNKLQQYENVIVKFGRYIPGQESVFDEVLGVYLSNKEQYALRIS